MLDHEVRITDYEWIRHILHIDISSFWACFILFKSTIWNSKLLIINSRNGSSSFQHSAILKTTPADPNLRQLIHVNAASFPCTDIRELWVNNIDNIGSQIINKSTTDLGLHSTVTRRVASKPN